MSVKIDKVVKNSAAYKKGIRCGDTLRKINFHEINDVLDYQFYAADERLTVDFTGSDGKLHRVLIKKEADEDLGLDFETYLMDSQQRCSNGCVFCFIDQLPKGMRDTLYFKDDDSRLSFLFGNYITLTNLSEHDVNRIIKMHISPVNVSVHTMNPELRVKMMKNKNAGKSLDILYRLAEAGIKLNTQLVLCPGLNDGDELEYSLKKLSELYPAVESIAAVPVGLTKHREKLCKLSEYTPETAKEVIGIVDRFSSDFKEKYGTRLAYCADEFYLKAGLDIPEEEYYEEYPQIENGVGLWKSLESEFCAALDNAEFYEKDKIISLATGVAAYPLMKKLCDAVCEKFNGIKINVYKIINDYFGHSITVAGLITGQDLIAQLKGKELGEKLLIPSVMLRSEQDMFLDDVLLSDACESLGAKIETVMNDGYDLLEKILN